MHQVSINSAFLRQSSNAIVVTEYVCIKMFADNLEAFKEIFCEAWIATDKRLLNKWLHGPNDWFEGFVSYHALFLNILFRELWSSTGSTGGSCYIEYTFQSLKTSGTPCIWTTRSSWFIELSIQILAQSDSPSEDWKHAERQRNRLTNVQMSNPTDYSAIYVNIHKKIYRWKFFMAEKIYSFYIFMQKYTVFFNAFVRVNQILTRSHLTYKQNINMSFARAENKIYCKLLISDN